MTSRASPLRVVRAFAETALVALAFGFAILLIGLPIALGVRLVHESLSWLARLKGEMGVAVEALVWIATVVGGIILTAAFARVVVGFFRRRGALRAEARNRDAPTLPATG
jgi:hypothetical protein